MVKSGCLSRALAKAPNDAVSQGLGNLCWNRRTRPEAEGYPATYDRVGHSEGREVWKNRGREEKKKRRASNNPKNAGLKLFQPYLQE
jgi:hypothetical protein